MLFKASRDSAPPYLIYYISCKEINTNNPIPNLLYSSIFLNYGVNLMLQYYTLKEQDLKLN